MRKSGAYLGAPVLGTPAAAARCASRFFFNPGFRAKAALHPGLRTGRTYGAFDSRSASSGENFKPVKTCSIPLGYSNSKIAVNYRSEPGLPPGPAVGYLR